MLLVLAITIARLQDLRSRIAEAEATINIKDKELVQYEEQVQQLKTGSQTISRNQKVPESGETWNFWDKSVPS